MILDTIITSSIIFVTLCRLTLAGQEVLLSSNDLSTHPKTEYDTTDRDGNSILIELDDTLGDLIFRLDSMPPPGEHGIEDVHEDNLALTPYIPNTKSAHYIKVEFQYDHVDICPTYSTITPVQCEDAFHFAAVTADSNQVDLSQINLGSSPAVIQFDSVNQSSITTSSQNTESTVNLPSGNPGFRIAFLDKGSKFNIKTLRIKQYICNSATFQDGLLTCPQVSAWSNGTRNVQCECDSVTSEPDSVGSNFVQCLTNGDYNSASVTTPCQCKPGYSFAPKPGATAQFECQAVTTAQPQTTTTSSTGLASSSQTSHTPNNSGGQTAATLTSNSTRITSPAHGSTKLNAAATSSKPEGLTPGALAGIVIASMVSVFALGMLAVYCTMQKGKSKKYASQVRSG